VEVWGKGQALVYQNKLDKAIQNIVDNTKIGLEISHKIRMLSVEKHRILYRLTKDKIILLRILHVKMNPKNSFLRI
ncbi:MAG: type II toxin-antitoxin system RelE/ParE family toxin, partial [Pseudomonadota bacterium]